MFSIVQSTNSTWQKSRPRRDSNSQSSDPKSDALSIRPRGHWRSLRQKMKYYMANKYNQIENVFLLDTCNLLMVLWCSGYHVCFTRRRSRVRTSPEPPLLEWAPRVRTWHFWCAQHKSMLSTCYFEQDSGWDVMAHSNWHGCFRCVSKPKGGNRSWTGDLSICSRMLCHWAIPPALLSRG